MRLFQNGSGAPLVLDEYQIGIYSFGGDCRLGFPSVFTDVYYYSTWIHNEMEEYENNHSDDTNKSSK